jgi:hypothetical protein
MKFGLRTPSFKKRLAARTSVKRYVRQNPGLKAPKGWGWLTNPQKAAYNRVYNRTTSGIGSLFGTRKRSGKKGRAGQEPAGTSGCVGCLVVFFFLGVLVAVVQMCR